MRKPPSLQSNTQAVHEWNALHNTGCAVNVTDDSGFVTRSETTSEAWLLGGHTAVIMLDGISGAYLLDRVKPVKKRYGSGIGDTCKACDCIRDNFGCGCNPHDA